MAMKASSKVGSDGSMAWQSPAEKAADRCCPLFDRGQQRTRPERIETSIMPGRPASLDCRGLGPFFRQRRQREDPAPDLFPESSRFALGHFFAFVQDNQPVAAIGLVEVGSGHQHPDLFFLDQPVNDLPQITPGHRVDAHGRLVEQAAVAVS